MAEIARAQQLYFYQLLSTNLGIGKQVRFSQVEEVLEADGLAPADVGCEDVGELLAALGEFVKVTTFRRGRVVAAVMRSEQFDEALERAAAAPVAKAAPQGKPWKAKGSKELRPERPKPARAARQEGGKGAGKEGPGPSKRVEEGRVPAADADDRQAKAAEGGTAAMEGAVSAEVVASEAAPVEPPVAEVEASGPQTGGATGEAGDGEPPSQGFDQKKAETSTDMAVADAAAGARVDEPAEHARGLAGMADEEGPSISLTITYSPDEPDEAKADSRAAEGTDGGARRREGTDVHARQRPLQRAQAGGDRARATELPRLVSRDAYCPDALALALYQAFPLGADYLAALDAAWDEARPQARTGVGGVVRFSLALPDGRTARIAMRRRAPLPSGRRWEVFEVDAGDSDRQDDGSDLAQATEDAS